MCGYLLHEWRGREKAAQFGFRDAQSLEGFPFPALADLHRLAHRSHLRRRHQAGVIVFMTGQAASQSP